jgi:hypothetical protein
LKNGSAPLTSSGRGYVRRAILPQKPTAFPIPTPCAISTRLFLRVPVLVPPFKIASKYPFADKTITSRHHFDTNLGSTLPLTVADLTSCRICRPNPKSTATQHGNPPECRP